jgi:excisionase family DNA binding protein
MSETERLISIGEAARLLGVSVPTLRGWDRSGRLRALRLPGERPQGLS